jgi:FMN phosphatase YigB (HAD superfamily)
MKFFLLDLTGTVFNNKVINQIIQSNSVAYIAYRLSIDFYTASTIINGENSHPTKLIDNSLSTLREYTQEVFSNMNTSDLSKYITDYDVEHVNKLISLKRMIDVDYILCTDAPLVYCIKVFKAMNMNLFDLFNSKHIFTSDIIGHVKQDTEYFNYIENELCHYEQLSVFIDNNIINVKSAKKNTKTCFQSEIHLVNNEYLCDCIQSECQ